MYQRQQDALAEERAIKFAGMDPMAQATYGIYRGAGQLGGALGRALGGEDPELARITARQQIAGQLDPNDLTTFDRGIQMMRQAGDGQGAMMLAMEREKIRQQALVRSDEALVRADAAAKRLRDAEALRQQQEAQAIAQRAFVPGGEPAFYGRASSATQLDDYGNLMPGAGSTAPSYDIRRVAPELMKLGSAGITALTQISKANEELAKADKLTAEAISAQQKARFAGSTEEAAASKALAEAVSAQEKARFAGPAEQAAALKATSEAQKATVEAKFAERLQAAGLNKTNWDVENLKSQINDRAGKLALDTQMTAATVAEKMSSINKNLTEMPADTRKLVNESAVTAATAKQSADQFNSLANRIEAQGGNYGIASSASDYMKKVGGFQGGMTQLKQEYIRLRNTAAIKSLPPGPATDKDIQLALSGFPSETARAGDLASFLRGMAKLQEIDSAVANAKTDWLAQNNGTLTRTNKTLMVGDFTARPGESFNDLSTRIVKDVNARYAGAGREAQREALIKQIPTGRSAPPAQPNILNQADAILQRR